MTVSSLQLGAQHASRVPPTDAELFFGHLDALREHSKAGFGALAMSSLAHLCATPSGAALAQVRG